MEVELVYNCVPDLFTKVPPKYDWCLLFCVAKALQRNIYIYIQSNFINLKCRKIIAPLYSMCSWGYEACLIMFVDSDLHFSVLDLKYVVAYGDSHDKDYTAVGPSYLYLVDHYTGKKASLY